MGNGGKKMGSGKLLRIVGVARGRLEKVEGSRRLVVDTQLEKMCSRIPITVGHFLVLQFSTKECAKTHSGLRASKSPSVNCSDDAPPPISAKKIRNTLLSPPLRSRDTKNVTKLLLARFRPPKKNWGKNPTLLPSRLTDCAPFVFLNKTKREEEEDEDDRKGVSRGTDS